MISLRAAARRTLQAATVARHGLYVAPGHYYSPIPSQTEVARALDSTPPVGIDLRESQQVALADRLAPLRAELPTETADGWRWHDGNNMYGNPDAATYYAMIADRKPGRVIEVGSGFSSAIALDAADRHSADTRFEFVEPYPDRLLGLLTPDDRKRTKLHRMPVQDVDLEVFTTLSAGDVLFIDSTHVAKAGSDVLYLYFEVLPRLAPGVTVHVHDIFWPFSYPERWLREGRAWNEAYLLRALLTEPSSYRILLWGSWLGQTRAEFRRSAAIWLERA